jgi:hypothetical protein
MEAARVFGTSLNFFQTARRDIPEDSHLNGENVYGAYILQEQVAIINRDAVNVSLSTAGCVNAELKFSNASLTGVSSMTA